MRVIFPSSCGYLLPNMLAGALKQIWPNQFWLRPFSWFSGFLPLFWRRLPLFSRGRCMRRQATTWQGRKFSWGGKKSAFKLLMWVLPNLISTLFLPLQFELCCWTVSWCLNMMRLVLMLDGFIGSWRLWFFLACLFSTYGFFQIGFCRSVSVKWKLAPHLRLPRPYTRSTLQGGETHIK